MSGSLGLGYNTQDSSSVANSNSYGYTTSDSASTSSSLSNSLSGGQSTSGQTLAFGDLFKKLYEGAAGAADNVAAGAPQLQQVAQQLFTGGSQFLQTLGSNPGIDYMTERLNGNNPAIDDVIASLRTDAGKLFSDQLNPAITSSAVAGGNLGGGRQGVAQGIAQGQVADSLLKQAAQIRYSDVSAKDAIAQNIATNNIAAANTGLGSLSSMLDLVERGQNAELAPYSSLASIMGGPTALNSSQSTEFSRSTAQSAADAFSNSFGEQTATSSSRSRGRGRGYSYQGSFSYGPSGGGGG